MLVTAMHSSSRILLSLFLASACVIALAQSPLELDETSLTIPLGTSRGVAIRGTQASRVEVSTSAADVATAERAPGGVRIRATGVGSASLLLRAGDTIRVLSVDVLPYAVTFPQALRVEVVGTPASGATVQGAIETALRTQLRKHPLAELSWSLPPVEAMGVGRTRAYQVRVRGRAPETFENVGNVDVIVRNLSLPAQEDDELWYCNYPEIVRNPRNLFAAHLRKETGARLLYHHVNGSQGPLLIRIQAVNNSSEPARVLLMPGDSRPNRDPVKAGLEAGAIYLRGWMHRSGEIVTIPPFSSMPIGFRRINPQETTSGLCTLRLLDGPDSLLVRTDALPALDLNNAWAEAERSPTPWRAVGFVPRNPIDAAPYELSKYVFPNPQRTERLAYSVGGRFGHVRIGQRPIAQEEHALNLDGNFGVIYRIQATLNNPTPNTADVELVFEASAGYSGALFLIDGAFQQAPLLMPKQETQIAKVSLPPGGSRTIQVTTIPLSGSSYPATLTARPVIATALHHLLGVQL
jgi:hypothetical protein